MGQPLFLPAAPAAADAMRYIELQRNAGGLPGVALVTLSRPEAKNALNKQLTEELAQCLDGLRSDPDLRALVLTGSGSAFCAGVDLKDPLFADPQMMNKAKLQGPSFYLWQMRHLQVPTIAAVNGPCITGGMEIALQCDLILASTAAVFRDTHTTYGIFPGGGMSQILPRMVGVQRARFMSLTGTPIDGRTAAAWGLACAVVEPDQLMPEALRIAASIAKKDPTAVAKFRSLINEAQGRSLPAALDFELDEALESYMAMGQGGGRTQDRLSSAFKTQQQARSKL